MLRVIRAKVQVTLIGRNCTASVQWYCSLIGVCYSEHYLEYSSQGWTVVLQLEWSALQFIFPGKYFTASGHWYCSLNVVCYSKCFLKSTLEQVDCGIAA